MDPQEIQLQPEVFVHFCFKVTVHSTLRYSVDIGRLLVVLFHNTIFKCELERTTHLMKVCYSKVYSIRRLLGVVDW
jgi:hypothetical protein